jgi:acyl-CoA reductase-like NAD-dependent aldehyde dehydrogenase
MIRTSGRFGVGFVVAALLLLATVVLPLGNPLAAGLGARPGLLVATLAAAALLVAASWQRLAIPFGFIGVLTGCVVAVALLNDPDVARYAASGFWTLTVGTWLGASQASFAAP